ncbi:MAG: glycosyltransferase [Prevotella sp.]|nr:glycosyltransferase [Prevotella sp.]
MFEYPALVVWGGIERVWVDRMNQLVCLYDYEVYLLTYNQGKHPIPYPLDRRVYHIDLNVQTHHRYSYHGLKRLWDGFCRQVRLYKRMKKAIVNIRPDIIVTPTIGDVSLLLRIKGQIPLVVESHSGFDHLIEFEYDRWINQFKIRRCAHLIHKANAIMSLTESDAQKWRLKYKRVYVIPNTAHLNPHGRYSSGEHKRVIFVGRIAKQKGIPELIAVWRLVHERYPDWVLDVYGEGDSGCFPQEDIGLNVHEPISDIFSEYIDSSMLLLTSVYEPFGLVIPEAMSCGLPVVAFESDGPCDIITDGEDGFIVHERDVEVFANRVCQLIEDKQLRQRMGRNAIQSAQRYAPEHIMPMWKQFYETLSSVVP